MKHEIIHPKYYAFGEFIPEWTEHSFTYPVGVRLTFEFENGYGASIIKNETSYGHEDDLWELAVLNLKIDKIDYSTPITDDVLGGLSDEEVENVLRQIRDLPSIIN